MKRILALVSMTVAAAFLPLMVGSGQPNAAQNNETGSTMSTFVFIFRQSPAELSLSDQKRRAEEVRAWAQRQNSKGHKLDPRMLGDNSYRIGPGDHEAPGGTGVGERLTAILFVEARDFAEAVSIAKTHPGLRYGAVSVEVRPWVRPVPPSAPPTPTLKDPVE